MKNKGFTLAEMVAVIAILMILALISTPFVKGYIDDAYNGKALIFMRQLNEARLNFERDYPGTTVAGAVEEAEGNKCNFKGIYSSTNVVTPAVLINCNYLHYPTDLSSRYKFFVGVGTASCDVCTKTPFVSMIGQENAGIYQNKCACIDVLGSLYKQDAD